MAQRNEDTEFWNTKFVRELKGPYKAFWKWLQSACNHAGIWEIDIDHARMRTGFFDLDLEEASIVFSSKILKLKCGEKWFLLDYPQDQFKTIFLNPTNTYHWGAIVILQKLGLMDNDFVILRSQMETPCKPLYSNSKDAKRKIKDIISNEYENVSTEVKSKKENSKKIEFSTFWDIYDKKIEANKCASKWDKLSLKDQQAAIDHIPQYKAAEPNKKFRKNPDTYLNNKSWLDEIISTASMEIIPGSKQPDRIELLLQNALNAKRVSKNGAA